MKQTVKKTIRKSHIAMLAAFALIFLITAGFITAARIIAVSPRQWDGQNYSSGAGTSLTDVTLSGFEEFSAVKVRGLWTVDIEQSDDFTIDLSYPPEYAERVRAEVVRGTLTLNIRRRRDKDYDNFSARIGMPSLESVVIEGLSDVWIAGFNQDSLELTLKGLANVESADSQVDVLNVSLDGAGRANLRGITAVDARVDMRGAGVVELTMDGGILEGAVEGVGSIFYSGPVAEQRVSIKGPGRVGER